MRDQLTDFNETANSGLQSTCRESVKLNLYLYLYLYNIIESIDITAD